jgi:ACDE family multidrug resistance protein
MDGKKWDLAALAFIPLIMTLGNSMLIPVLPLIEKKINITGFQSSLLISIYSIVSIGLIPIAGFLSDRYGRKKIILPSLFLTGLGGLISGIAAWKMEDPYNVILLGRMIQGVGSSGAFPVVIPTVGDLFAKDSDISKGLGVIETSNTFGKVLSPILGSFLATLIWFAPFLFIPLLSVTAMLMVGMLVKLPANNQTNKMSFKKFWHQIGSILQQKGRWLYAIFFLGWVGMFVYFGILIYFTTVLENKFGIEALTRGFIIAIPLLGLCITSFLVGEKMGKQKKLMKWIAFGGTMLTSGAMLVAAWQWKSLIVLITIFIFAGIGIGALLPSLDAMITEGIEKEHRGTVTSLYSSMRLLGVALGSSFAALMLETSVKALFVILLAVGLVAGTVILGAIKPKDDMQAAKT